MTPLKQVAAISVPESSTLLITPYDTGAIKDIERAINVGRVTWRPSRLNACRSSTRTTHSQAMNSPLLRVLTMPDKAEPSKHA